jgi:hypothetical protein
MLLKIATDNGLALSAENVRDVIKLLDSDNDGHVGLPELEAAMKVMHSVNGVEGSPWKIYVDPAQDVIVYHNFRTREKIFEHNMTDKILMEIVMSNFVARDEVSALDKAKQDRKADLEARMQDYAVRVLQRMYVLWKHRQVRQQKQWKIEASKLTKERKDAKLSALYIQRIRRATLWRQKLWLLLQLVWEKRHDSASAKWYYTNHQDGEVRWESPKLLNTYHPPKVLEDPPEWSVEAATDGRQYFYNWKTGEHRWGKPPGVPRCCNCYSNIAARRSLTGETAGQPFCFACFREHHIVYVDRSGKAGKLEWSVVEPTMCNQCKKLPAGFIDITAEPRRPLCGTCKDRLEKGGAASPLAGHQLVKL